MIPSGQIDTPEKREQWQSYLARYYRDRRWAIENHLKIRTKDQRLIKLKLNEAQDRLYQIVEKQEAAGIPVRIIGVKPRKVGLSTGIQALFFHRASTRKLQKALTVAHDLDSTEEMFQMSDLFFNEIPEQLKPMKRYGSRGELVFENPDEESRRVRPGLRSQLKIGTAGKVEVGRSKDIHLLHASEVPYWPDAEKTELSLLNAVPDLASTMVFKEGTPNGVGTKFYRDYEDAKAGRSAYAPYFMAWWEFREYQMPLTMRPDAFEDTVDDEEGKIRKVYNLTPEQLNWRRWAIMNKCGGDTNKFDQEYPSNDVDCFLVSGRPRFDTKKLHEMLLAAKDPTAQGLLLTDGSRVKFQEQPQGFVRIWKPPILAKRYVLGADVAEGLADGDFSCGHVYDWETCDLCAEWHGHIEPDLFGQELGKLGKIYTNALIGIEVNKDSTPATRLRNEGYPHLFYRKQIDTRTKKPISRLGWLTTEISKTNMIDTLAAAILEGAKIPSRETISEMMTFVYHDNGSLGAQSGCFDDRVVASAIALEIRKRQSMDSIYPPKKP